MVFQNVGPVMAPNPNSAGLSLHPISHGRSVDGTLGCPAGFPDYLRHPLAWRGSQLSQGDQLIHQLNADDLAEIKLALASFKGEFSWPQIPHCPY